MATDKNPPVTATWIQRNNDNPRAWRSPPREWEVSVEDLTSVTNTWKVKALVTTILEEEGRTRWEKGQSLETLLEGLILPALRATRDQGARKVLGDLAGVISSTAEEMVTWESPPLDLWWTRNHFPTEGGGDVFQDLAALDEEEILSQFRTLVGEGEIPEEDLRKTEIFTSSLEEETDAPAWRSKTYCPEKNWIHNRLLKERRDALLEEVMERIPTISTREGFMKAYHFLREQSRAAVARNKGEISHTFLKNGRLIATERKGTRPLPTGLDYKRYARAMNYLNAHGLRANLVSRDKIKWLAITDMESEPPAGIPEDALDAPRRGLWTVEGIEGEEPREIPELPRGYSTYRPHLPWVPSRPLEPSLLWSRMTTEEIERWLRGEDIPHPRNRNPNRRVVK